MILITKKCYENIGADYAGESINNPGVKCVMLGCIKQGGGSTLVYENSGFCIIPDVQKLETWAEGFRWTITINDNFVIEIGRTVHDLKSKHDLMNIWHKAGYIPEKLKNHICLHTYYTDEIGNCCGAFNPCEIFDTKANRNVVNFENVLEFTSDNLCKLINEAIGMYNNGVKHYTK